METNAIILTLAISVVIVIACNRNWIDANERFNNSVYSADVGVVGLYLVDFVLLSAFNTPVPYLHEGGWQGILLAILLIITSGASMASLLQLLQTARHERCQSYVCWFYDVGVLLSVFWFYLEIVELLRKLYA